MEVKTVRVLEARFPEAQAALDKIIRKAHRLGLTDFSYSAADPYPVQVRRVDCWGQSRLVEVLYRDLRVTGAALKIGDHEFLARLEVTPDGVLVDRLPSVQDLDPRFLHTDGACQHCKTSRNRRHLFVVRDRRDGSQIQVGHQCLRPYLGVDNPATIAQAFRTWGEVLALGDEDRLGGIGGQWRASVQELLEAASVIVKLEGWISRAASEATGACSTSARVAALMSSDRHASAEERRWRERCRAEWVANAEEHRAAVQAARDWLDTQPASSEYLHNLKVLLTQPELHDPRRVSIVVSLIGSHQRALGQLKAREPSHRSRSVGMVGQRLRDLPVTLEKNIFVSSGAWGDQYLLKFRNAEGDILCWFTGRRPIAEGEKLLLTGTVTKHEEYRGDMQTMLGRCMLQRVE